MSTSVFQRKLDFAPAASINKVALNNKVVMMRAVVRRAKLHLINKLVKMMQKLKNKKGTEEQQKSNKNKADRLLEEIKIIKMLRHDYVSKFALGSTEIFEEVAKNPNSTIDKRALVRLSQQKFIQDVVTKFRREHDDWKELAAYLMTKHTSREYKTKKTKQKMKTVEANVKLTETLVQAYLGEKLGDVKHDDNNDNAADADDDYENQGENDGPDSDIVRSSDGLEKINESHSDEENNEINENNDSAEDNSDDDVVVDDDDDDDDDDDNESAESEEDDNLTESSSSKNIRSNRNVKSMRNLSSSENVNESDDDNDDDDDDDDDESSDQDNVNEHDENDDDEVSGSNDEESDDDDDDDDDDNDNNDDDDDENLSESDELIKDHIGSVLESKKSSETKLAKAGLLTRQEKPEPKSQQRHDKKENKKKSQKNMGEKNPCKPKMVEKVQGEMIVKKINLDSLAEDNEIPAILLTNSSEEKPIKKKKRKDMFFEMDDDDDDGESGIDDGQIEEGGEYGGTEGYGDYPRDGGQGQGVQLGMNAFSTTFVGSLRSSEMMGCKDGKYRSNEDWKRIRHEMKDAKMGRGGGSSFPPRGRGQGSFGGRGSFRGQGGSFRGQGGSFRGQDSIRGQGSFRGRGSFGDQGSFRGQGSFRAQDSRGRGGFSRGGQTGGDSVKPKPQKAESLHPSWEASKKRKQQEKGGIQAFTGKKIKFD